MSRGVWLNAFVAVLAAVSLLAVWLTRDVAMNSDKDLHSQHLLPEFRGEDATRLELRHAEQPIAIERTTADGGPAAFFLVAPVKELADAATVDKFLAALAGARALRPVEPGPALESFGLDKPSLRIDVRTPQRVYHLALGGRAPTPEGARYARLSRDADPPSLVVISKSVVEDLDLELDAFRLRSLLAVSEADVSHLVITSSTLQLSLRRSTSTSFLVDGEPKLLADRDTVRSLFFQLSRLSASRFLALNEAQAALRGDRAQLEIETKAPPFVMRLDVGGSCPDRPTELVVIRRSPDPQAACAGRELEATLRLTQSDFLDRHAFSLHADEVEELEISGEPTRFVLVRKGSGFVLRGKTEAQVELEAGNQRILALLEATGDRVEKAPLSELGLEPALGTVTLRSSAARETEVIRQVVRVGKRDDRGNRFVYREQDGALLRIPPEPARAFSADSTLLYARKLTEFGPSSFISAEIIGPSGKQRLLRAANQELQLEAPPGFRPDGVLSSDLIQALGALNAERFVADRDDGSFGFEPTALSVRFAFKSNEGQELTRLLRFGRETALGTFATLDEGGPVFVLSRSVRDTCDLLLINRAIFPSDTSTLRKVTLSARGHTLELERHGEHFSVAPGSAFPEERSADLLEALGDLRPEAAVHIGAARPAEGFSRPSLTVRWSPTTGPAQLLTFGAGDSWRSTSVFYLRVSGVEATFVIAQSKVRALSDAL